MLKPIHSSFAYAGHDFSLIQEESITYIAGNSVIIWNSATGKKDYIWSKRSGYCCSTSNYHKNLIAAAEYGLNPEIHIYKYPGKDLVHKFKADTTIRLIDMAFSRDGRYLIMIGGIPDFRISIFDLETNKRINLSGSTNGTTLQECKIPCKPGDYRKVKFNPSNSREFCILASNSIYFYKVHQGYEITEQDDQKYLGESERLSFIEYKNENPELQYTYFVWDQYKRVHVCCDLPMLLQIDSQTANLEGSLSLTARPLTCLMTQRHMIVSTEDCMIAWYRIALPEIVIGTDANADQRLTVTEDVDQEYKFEKPIAFMHYTRSFKKLICGTHQGLIGILAIEAEAINEDEEDEENQHEKETKVLVTPFVELGRFHTAKVSGIKELGETTQLVTISDDKTIGVWEATQFNQISRISTFSTPTALDVSKDGKVAFVGSEKGIFRIFDLSNRAMPRLLKLFKFFDNTISINSVKSSPCGKFVIISSQESENVFVISQQAEHEFEVYGHVNLEGYVTNTCFTVHEGQSKVLAILSNALLAGFQLPEKHGDNRMESIPENISKVSYRRIDRGMQIVMSNIYNGDIFVSGEDKFLKKYEYPTEAYNKIDFKKPPNPPLDELKSHDIGTTCCDFSNEVKFMVTGGKDGNIIVRNMNHVAQNNNEVQGSEIKGHAVFVQGITALTFSKVRSTLYTAGGDGAFFAWTLGGKPNPSQPVPLLKGDLEAIDKIDQIDDLPEYEIRPYKEILQDLFHKQQASKKERFKEEIMSELEVIKQKLHELLDENDRVTDIEKLERDEFVIDVEKRDKANDQGEKVCDEIRKEAEKKQLELELLRERVQQTTWDKMDIQNKAIKSIKGDMLVFNYGIRKRAPEEHRRLHQIINFRRNELREKLQRLESKLQEVLDENDFSRLKEGYIMNRIGVKPLYEDDQSIQEAAASFAAKDAEKKSKKLQEEKKLQQAGQQQQQTGKRVPTIKITKGKLGQKTKKKDPDEELRNAQKDKMQQREIRGMEEIYWSVKYALKTLDEVKKNLDNPNIWDLIYESYDLYTDPRKRMQIELLREVIFELKRDYNKEFESLEKFKEDSLFTIKEKNEMIKELLHNLKQEEEIFEPLSHPLEFPEHIFEVKEDEIGVEKFLTKEERTRLEEERLKQEARERALQGDNVGQRGLKSMMGGTELNLKKDQNQIQNELIREDWMNKPYDDMNDEEKLKLKEFEQKEKEFKEKQKKAWEQDLKKIKGEIIEIQLRFEERILMLFKKKLFFDVRVMEQELYIIRLTIMLHDAKETGVDQHKYLEERDKLEKELKEKEEMISNFYNFQQDLETQQRNNTSIQEQEKELKRMFPDVNIKQILNFVRQGRSKKPGVGQGEPSSREQELLSKVVDLDPFSAIDKEKVKQVLKDEEEKETYVFEKDNVAGLNEEDFDKLVQERYNRIEMEKDKNRLSTQIQQLKDHVNFLELLRNDNNEKYQHSYAAQKKASDRVEKLKYNYEMIVYLKQGQVEVPQLPVATDYKDAILIKRDVIEDENREISKRGDAKVKMMNAISEFKTGLKRVRYQKKKLDMEILDFEERAKDVQLYRVTKQTQEIIQGKHQKKDEEDKKRLDNQIRQLDENAQKRIKTIFETKKKLKKEIMDKMKENEQLETKARQLQQNVDQRKQIMGLKSKTSTDGVADPTKKIKEIAHKRKLMDIVKQQTEEIEYLRDELDRLRARTFPSFAHLHNKPEFPDEA
eukprot:403336298